MSEWYFEDQLLDMDLSSIDSNQENFNLFDFLGFSNKEDKNEIEIKSENKIQENISQQQKNVKNTTTIQFNSKPTTQFEQMNNKDNNNNNNNFMQFNQQDYISNYYDPTQQFSQMYDAPNYDIGGENNNFFKSEFMDDVPYNYPNKRKTSRNHLNNNNNNINNNNIFNPFVKSEYNNINNNNLNNSNNNVQFENNFTKNKNNFDNFTPISFFQQPPNIPQSNIPTTITSSSSFQPQLIKSEYPSPSIPTTANQPKRNLNGNPNKPKTTSQRNLPTKSNLAVLTQPPIEVRLRTNGDKRCFKVKVQLKDHKDNNEVAVEIVYSRDRLRDVYERVERQDILGGTKKVKVESDGGAIFKNLCVWEASKKHDEREFSLRFYVVGKGENEDMNSDHLRYTVMTDSFYAYSHQRILSKRKALTVRTLNKIWGKESEIMHIVGKGFIEGPHVGVVVIRKDGQKFFSSSVEFYSESVIFFQLPFIDRKMEEDVEVDVCITNDGRNFSNPLKLFYQKSI